MNYGGIYDIIIVSCEILLVWTVQNARAPAVVDEGEDRCGEGYDEDVPVGEDILDDLPVRVRRFRTKPRISLPH